MATKISARSTTSLATRHLAAALALESGRHPGQLKDEVCSPAGSTIAGVHALERAGLRAAAMDAVAAALEKNEPYLLSRALIELAQAYNRFYYEERIITEDSAQTAARLQLTKAVRTVLKTGLGLLGIASPERM